VIDEAVTRERMRALADAGDYAAALAEYAGLELQLAADPGVKPERETRRLFDELRRHAPPPLGAGRLRLVELEGDHTDAERAELHDGEVNAFESLDLGLVWRDHDRRIVIVDRGRMIACSGLVVAPVQAGEETFDVVGFGGVIVTHTRRAEGLARKVLEAAIERASTLGPTRGLLFCRPDRAGLYARLGFEHVRAPVNVGQPSKQRADLPLDTLWRPLRSGATWPDGDVVVPGLPF
jgi:predicted N-acetyltransferase YhbS